MSKDKSDKVRPDRVRVSQGQSGQGMSTLVKSSRSKGMIKCCNKINNSKIVVELGILRDLGIIVW